MAVQDMSGKQKFDSFRSHVAWPCLLGDFFSMAFWGIGKPGNHLWVFHGFPQKSSRNSQYEPIMPIVGTLDSSFVMLEQLWQLVGIFCQPPWLRFWWFNPMSPMAIMWGSFYILPEWLQFCLNMTCWACGPPRNKLYDLWYIYIQICTSCTNTTYTFFYVLWSLYVSQSCHSYLRPGPPLWSPKHEAYNKNARQTTRRLDFCKRWGFLPVETCLLHSWIRWLTHFFRKLQFCCPTILQRVYPIQMIVQVMKASTEKEIETWELQFWFAATWTNLWLIISSATAHSASDCQLSYLYINVTSPYRITYPICLMYGVLICIWLKFVWEMYRYIFHTWSIIIIYMGMEL